MQSYTMGRVESKGAQHIGNGILVRGGVWLLLAVLLAAVLWPFRGYVTDDTFIHLQFARNLAQGHGFAFEAGRQVYGFTSPLWVILLGAADALGLPGLGTARALGLVFTVASIAGVRALAREWMSDGRFVWTATIAWAFDAWLLRWTYSGMETSLAVAAVVWAFVLLARARAGRGSTFAALAGAALVGVVRPEGLALVFLVWADLTFFAVGGAAAFSDRTPAARRPLLRTALLGWVPVFAVLGPWLVFAWVTFGQVLPSTIAAKSPKFLWTPGELLERVVLLNSPSSERPARSSWSFSSSRPGSSCSRAGADGRRGTLAVLWDRYRLAFLVRRDPRALCRARDSGLVSRYLMVPTPIPTVLAWSPDRTRSGVRVIVPSSRPGSSAGADVAGRPSSSGVSTRVEVDQARFGAGGRPSARFSEAR
ncbi:MAG: hypothetical protein R3E97_14465 [Candidatus Eisenbacteria bacterium]